MSRFRKLEPTRNIAIDVDGTLLINGTMCEPVVEFCRRCKAEGRYSLTLWSARGKEYSQMIADHFGITDLFDDIVSKPGYIVDDQGWDWIRHTVVITSLDEIEEADG